MVVKLSREAKVLVGGVTKSDKIEKVLFVDHHQCFIRHIAIHCHHFHFAPWLRSIVILISLILSFEQIGNKIKLIQPVLLH